MGWTVGDNTQGSNAGGAVRLKARKCRAAGAVVALHCWTAPKLCARNNVKMRAGADVRREACALKWELDVCCASNIHNILDPFGAAHERCTDSNNPGPGRRRHNNHTALFCNWPDGIRAISQVVLYRSRLDNDQTREGGRLA
jgi:hypothetical protein